MTDLNFQVRYFLEQRFLPQNLYSEYGSNVIAKMLQGRGAFFVQVLNYIGENENYKCPYTEAEFVFKPLLVGGDGSMPEFAVLAIDMPAPEKAPLCSRIFICHDSAFSNIRYYTIEKTINNSYMLCGTSGEDHINYGTAPGTEKELFYRICNLYMDHLKTGNSDKKQA